MVVRKWSFAIKIVAVVCLFAIVTGQRRNFSQQQRIQQNNVLRQRSHQNAHLSRNNQRQVQNVGRNNLQMQRRMQNGQNIHLQFRNEGRSPNNQMQGVIQNGRSSFNNQQMQPQNGRKSLNNQQTQGRLPNSGLQNNQQTLDQMHKGRNSLRSQRQAFQPTQVQLQNSQRTLGRLQNDRGSHNHIIQSQIQNSGRPLHSQHMQNVIKNNGDTIRNRQMQNQLHKDVSTLNSHQANDMTQRRLNNADTTLLQRQQKNNRRNLQNDQLASETGVFVNDNPRRSRNQLSVSDHGLTRENLDRRLNANFGNINAQAKMPLDIRNTFNERSMPIQNQNSIRRESLLINNPIGQKNSLPRNQRIGNFESKQLEEFVTSKFRELQTRQDIQQQHLNQNGGHLRNTSRDVLNQIPEARNTQIRDVLDVVRELISGQTSVPNRTQQHALGRDVNHGLYPEKNMNRQQQRAEAGIVDSVATFVNKQGQSIEPFGGHRFDSAMVPDTHNPPVDRFLESNKLTHKMHVNQSSEAGLLLDHAAAVDRTLVTHARSANVDHKLTEKRMTGIESKGPGELHRSLRLNPEAGRRAHAGDQFSGIARHEQVDPLKSSLNHGHIDTMGFVNQERRQQEILKNDVGINVDSPRIDTGFHSLQDTAHRGNVMTNNLSNPRNLDAHNNPRQTQSPNDVFQNHPTESHRIIEKSRQLMNHLKKLQSSISTLSRERTSTRKPARKDLRNNDVLFHDRGSGRNAADIVGAEHRPIHIFDKPKHDTRQTNSIPGNEIFPAPQDSHFSLLTSPAPPTFAKDLHRIDPQSLQPLSPSSNVVLDQQHYRQDSRNTHSSRARRPQFPPDVHRRGGQQYPNELSRPAAHTAHHEARKHHHVDAHLKRYPTTDYLPLSSYSERHQTSGRDPYFRDHPPSHDRGINDRYGRYREPALSRMEYSVYHHPSSRGRALVREPYGGQYSAYEAYPQHGREMFQRPMHHQRHHHVDPPFIGSIANPHPPSHIRHGSPEFVNWLKTMDALGIDTMYEMPDITDPPLPSTTMPPPPLPTVVNVPPLKPLKSLTNKDSGLGIQKQSKGISDVKMSSKSVATNPPLNNSTLPTKSPNIDTYPHQAKFNAVLDYMQQLLTLQKDLIVSKTASSNFSTLNGNQHHSRSKEKQKVIEKVTPTLQDHVSAGPRDIKPEKPAEYHQQKQHHPSENHQASTGVIQEPRVQVDQTHLIDVPLNSLNQPKNTYTKHHTKSSRMRNDPYVQVESLHTNQTHLIDVPLTSLSQPPKDSQIYVGKKTQQLDAPQAKPKLSIVPSSELLQYIVGKATLPGALDAYYKTTKPQDATLIQRFPSREPRSGVALGQHQTITSDTNRGSSLNQRNINDIIKDINSMRHETSLGNIRDINKIGEQVIADSTRVKIDSNRPTKLVTENSPKGTDSGEPYHTLYQISRRSNFPYAGMPNKVIMSNKPVAENSPKGTGISKPYHTVYQVNKRSNVPSYSSPLISSNVQYHQSGFGQAKNTVTRPSKSFHQGISFGKQSVDHYETLSKSPAATNANLFKLNVNKVSTPLAKSSESLLNNVATQDASTPMKVGHVFWKPESQRGKVSNSNTQTNINTLWSSKENNTIVLPETTPLPVSMSTTQLVDLLIQKHTSSRTLGYIEVAKQRLREKMELKGMVTASTNESGETVPAQPEPSTLHVVEEASGKTSDKILNNPSKEMKLISSPEPSSHEEPGTTEVLGEPTEGEPPAGDHETAAKSEEGDGAKAEKGDENSSEYYYYYYYDD